MRRNAVKAVIGIAAVVLGLMAADARAQDAAPDKNGIVWYTPVSDESADKPVAYEEAAASAVATPVPAADDDCTVGESPFMLAWLAAGPRMAASQPQRPRIVIVIDDMGIDKKRSARVMRLPAPLTLSFLPYATHVQEQVDAARARGYAIMAHIPMQPDSDRIDPGPNVLRGDVPPDELQRRIIANLDGFSGYTGINNHMGSRFTRNRAGLEVVMRELVKRHLYFLDSKTHPDSVAAPVAAEAGLATARRDVFIDHVETPEAVAKALARTEYFARRHGGAIAIGHPKDVTIEGLATWLPTLKAKGFDVVTIDQFLRERQAQVLQAVRHTP